MNLDLVSRRTQIGVERQQALRGTFSGKVASGVGGIGGGTRSAIGGATEH